VKEDLTGTEENIKEIVEAERIATEEEAVRMAEKSKQFDEFYKLIIKAYEVWCGAHGDSTMMYETVQTLVEARDSFCKKK
jgi:plasmid maintenance system antidote protein VapI